MNEIDLNVDFMSINFGIESLESGKENDDLEYQYLKFFWIYREKFLILRDRGILESEGIMSADNSYLYMVLV